MKIGSRLKTAETRCLTWVALCFGLTSAVYLSWLDRLVAIAGAERADWFSLVAGYLFQAAGMGAVSLWLRKKPAENHQRVFLVVTAVFAAVAVPTLLADTPAGVIAFGLGMNGLCGAMAGFYLYGIGAGGEENHRSTLFGGGYALATVAVGLLALADGGALLHGRWALALYLPLAAAIMGLTLRWRMLAPAPAEAEGEAQQNTILLTEQHKPAQKKPDKPAAGGMQQDTVPLAAQDKPGQKKAALPSPGGTPVQGSVFWLACGTVFLISLVKNLGFGFPSADIAAGLIPEITRMTYAIGLVAAGLLNDRNRQTGLLCTLFALIIPFLMLGLIHEPVSSTVFWGLDYLFYAFFSVFRVTLFLDLADKRGDRALAPLGLMIGRMGDAAGTAVNLVFSGRAIVLVSLTGVLFVVCGFLLFRVHEMLYRPENVQAHREQEIFDAFCRQHDFSPRERDIFRLITEGRTNGQIAETLFISENTVKFHVRNLLQKTGCANRVELAGQYEAALNPEGHRARLKIV